MSAPLPYPLPDERHLPGRTARPTGGPVLAAAADAPDRTDPEAWTGNAAYGYGFRLLASGFFWEAHEVWEPVWAGCAPNSRARALLQGLIQSANTGLKLALDRPAAARKLAVHAADCFASAAGGPTAPDRVMGVNPTRASEAMRAIAERLGTGSDGRVQASDIAECPVLQPAYAL